MTDDTDKKAIAMGLVFSVGNSAGIVASEVYRAKDKPRFLLGHGCAVGFSLLNFTMATILTIYNRRENARRDAKYGVPSPDDPQDVDSPEYRQRCGLESLTREEIVELGDQHPAHRYLI